MKSNIGLFIAILLASPVFAPATDVHVSPNGNDAAGGTQAAPFRTIARARDELRKHPGAEAHVVLHGGTYYLDDTLIFTADDHGSYEPAPGEKVVISGGVRLDLKWTPYKNGIFQAPVAGVKEGKLAFDQLFANGSMQHLARYPNFDAKADHYNGVAADCLSPERIKTWAHPETAILHALHGSAWGDFHYRVTGVDAKGNAILQGGWQNNRASGPSKSIRFVENVFEELDAPGEWFLDKAAGMLYFFPPPGMDLNTALFEAPHLKHIVEFQGSAKLPVEKISFGHIVFTHALRTFMEKYEPLLRTDWAIYRGGAILLNGTRNITVSDCDFVNLGGNAIFINGYNRDDTLAGCKFENIGASAVCFVGLTSAVRSPTSWNHGDDWATVDRTPGPASEDYPADCKVSDCLIHHIGMIEKQTAGVEIDMAQSITVDHCSIYDCPRAGVNIGDGCWGGHIIENCDVFDTVKETGDHGSFNSWGRDRYWEIRTPAGTSFDELIKQNPNLPDWDVVKPITLRNSRWRCDHGWDIDLDDGSSNYHIYNNLCLHGGIKNREGFDRIVENNILVDNSFHPHVWYNANRGVFEHNIVMQGYHPVRITAWGDAINFNLFANPSDLQTAREKYHTDADSLAGDPMFIDPARGDYRVKDDSPALKIGFKNFPMDQFGVVSPRLRAEAKAPVGLAFSAVPRAKVDAAPHAWLGGTVRNIVDLDDRSAYGLPDETGVLVLDVPKNSELAATGLLQNDVIVELNKKPIQTVQDLLSALVSAPRGTAVGAQIFRSGAKRAIEWSTK